MLAGNFQIRQFALPWCEQHISRSVVHDAGAAGAARTSGGRTARRTCCWRRWCCVTDSFEGILGQTSAVSALRNAVSAPLPAYLFVGPAGCGARTAATRFAAELLAVGSQDPERHKRLAIAEEHPDFILFERNGPS